jgi:hypothetical protein
MCAEAISGMFISFSLWQILFFSHLYGLSARSSNEKSSSSWEFDLSISRISNHTLVDCSKNAIITFIMPSSGSRSSIQASVSSLLSLSSCYWRLIIVYSISITSSDRLETYPPIQLSRYSQQFERDPRIFYLPYQRKSLYNYGGNSRNAAFKHSTTEWIGFVDDDDELSSEYLTILTEESHLHPDISVVLFRMSCDTCYAEIIPPINYPNLLPGYVGESSLSFSRNLRHNDNRNQLRHPENSFETSWDP